MEIWKTAWRNVWRSRRRTLVTVSAMSFALWVMILYSGLLAGYLRDMERGILDLEIGDLQVHAIEYRGDPSLYARIDDPEVLLKQLRSEGFRATPRLLAWGMAAADESSAGVSFRGVDVAADALVSRIHEHVMEGSWLDPADPHGVVLGRRLARMLGVGPGVEIVVLSQGADGATAADLFEVRGVLQSIGDATDRAGVFMNADAFRELFVVPLGAHQIVVRRPPEVALDSAAVAVRGLAPGLDVQTWRELMPTMASLLDSAKGAMLAMFFIVYLAIAVLILNSMLMAVFERIRELGVLKALGVGPAGILGLMLAEAGIVTAISVAAGLAVGLPSLLYLAIYGIELTSVAGLSIMGMAMDPHWRAEMSVGVVLAPVGALVAIVSVAVLYPALKAAWIDPVRAIYHR
ncbi:MAG: ABC transporter permease [Deltaproteobacteria bacterium]|nr:ABC transporter permease [Deltaproteobacteria bacterium]